MGDFSQVSLVAAAGVDPWKLRDQFTAGDPEENYARAHYGNETRWTRHEPAMRQGKYAEAQVPDGKGKTETLAPVVPAAG
ncbi:hypothetical protein [Dactylosporangium sp. CS-033363]|uniref:putative alpha/beta hydrolase n=1 Tax=Dactylosporangium sp. CS-033363 TaxID=3239935 RepID=UPI003D8BDAA5